MNNPFGTQRGARGAVNSTPSDDERHYRAVELLKILNAQRGGGSQGIGGTAPGHYVLGGGVQRPEPQPSSKTNFRRQRETKLDSLIRRLGVLKEDRFAGHSAGGARNGAQWEQVSNDPERENQSVLAQDYDGDGKQDLTKVCFTDIDGFEKCHLVPVHKETEEERKLREREEIEEKKRREQQKKEEQELKELEQKLKEMEQEQERLRKNDNILSTQECQKDPNCRLA